MCRARVKIRETLCRAVVANLESAERDPEVEASGEVRALQLDGGNAWYLMVKLQNGPFLSDYRQEWASVFTWEFQALNNQGLTPQQAMDKEFAEKGIPAGCGRRWSATVRRPDSVGIRRQL